MLCLVEMNWTAKSKGKSKIEMLDIMTFYSMPIDKLMLLLIATIS